MKGKLRGLWRLLGVGVLTIPFLAEGRAADRPVATPAVGREAVAVTCEVEGRTTILSLLPAGSRVKKGDVLCELDATRLNNALIENHRLVESALSDLNRRRLAREAAEIGLAEHEALTRFEREGCQGEKKLAESQVELAKLLVKEARERHGDGAVAVSRAEAAVAVAEGKRLSADRRSKELEKVVIPARGRERQAQLEAARNDERVRDGGVAKLRERGREIERQVALCRVVAPVSGVLLYARWQVTESDEPRAVVVEKGATVRERQVLFRVVVDPPPRGPSF